MKNLLSNTALIILFIGSINFVKAQEKKPIKKWEKHMIVQKLLKSNKILIKKYLIRDEHIIQQKTNQAKKILIVKSLSKEFVKK